MTKQDSGRSHIHLTTSRIEALTDCIFAFAMTLLVLNLSLPETSGTENISLVNLLTGQMHRFYNFVLSFILLAIFWVVHHQQFHWIKRTDSRLLWLNIVMLIFVVLMPFSTDLIGDFNSQTLAEVFFAGNICILGLLYLAIWSYATVNHRLIDPDVDDAIIVRGIRRNFVVPAVSVFVIIMSFIIPNWSMLFYLLVPVIINLKPFQQ